MKLLIIAGLVTVCAAGRLEHLENQKYLPPNQGSDSGGKYGASSGTFGGEFNKPGFGGGAPIKDSNINIAPDKDGSASENDPEFAGYFYGPGISNVYKPQYDEKNQNQFGQQNVNKQFGQQPGNTQFGQLTGNKQFGQPEPSPAASNQLLTPEAPKKPFGQHQEQFNYQAASQISSGEPAAQGSNPVSSQYYPEPSAPNKDQPFVSNPFQNIPQQAFDETGYHY